MNLTKTYGYGNSQNTQVLTAGASTTATGTALTALKVRIATTAAIYLNFGISSVTATTSNMILPANSVEYFTIDLAQGFTYVAVLQVTTAGQVSITEVH